MRFFEATALLLALGATAAAGHSHHAFKQLHEPAISYAVVANHPSVPDNQIFSPYEHKHLDGHKDHSQKHYHVHEDINEDDDIEHSNAKYEFKYGVNDPKTGDIKEHWESRDGDQVKGRYSLRESDGTTRVVNYAADKSKGFEAVVQKLGHARQGLHTHVDYKYKKHEQQFEAWHH